MSAQDRERQVAELELLSSMFLDELQWHTPPHGSALGSLTPASEFEVAVTLDASYTLNIALPLDYPSKAKPRPSLSCGPGVDRTTQKVVRSQLSDIVDNIVVGNECLDVIVAQLTEALAALEEGRRVSMALKTRDTRARVEIGPCPIQQAVVWSHHLLATSKRRSIITWSKELELGGFSRPGYPGAIFIEGEEDSVKEFIRRIKELRWQALQVRDFRVCEKRFCGDGNGVVEAESLGEIVEALRITDHDSANMFLDGMKIWSSGQ